MAFTGNFMCTSFKQEILVKGHDFTTTTGDVFKMALFTNSQAGNDTLGGSGTDMDATVTNYAAGAANQVVGTGYTIGGNALANVTPTSSGTTAFVDFDDEVWSTATFTARGALIYNDSSTGTPITTDASVIVLDFGSDKTATAGDFTVQFPAADSTNAIIRIA